MKILESASINPFGGINFVFEELDKLKIGKLLNKELPDLATLASARCRYRKNLSCGVR